MDRICPCNKLYPARIIHVSTWVQPLRLDAKLVLVGDSLVQRSDHLDQRKNLDYMFPSALHRLPVHGELVLGSRWAGVWRPQLESCRLLDFSWVSVLAVAVQSALARSLPAVLARPLCMEQSTLDASLEAVVLGLFPMEHVKTLESPGCRLGELCSATLGMQEIHQ